MTYKPTEKMETQGRNESSHKKRVKGILYLVYQAIDVSEKFAIVNGE